MKKFALTLSVMATLLASASEAQAQTMTRQKDGTYVVNTTEICSSRGFRGKTPIRVYIKKDKIEKIEIVSTKDNPQYYTKAMRGLQKSYVGKKVNKAKNMKVDAVTGATYSSRALIDNVKAAVAYYKKNK